MFGIGIEELLLILVIVLLLFGGKKLPELARGLGESLREIRKGFTGDDADKDGKKKESKG